MKRREANTPGLLARILPATRSETRKRLAAIEKRMKGLGELGKLKALQQDTLKELVRQGRALAAQRTKLLEIAQRNKSLEKDVKALLRGVFVNADDLESPFRFVSKRFCMDSQNEEDGMTLALFHEIGVERKVFAEIGCGTNGGNSGFFARECGWSGLMVDGSEENIRKIREKFGGERVKAVCSWVKRENINQLLEQNGITGDVDLFSLDIDGVDYWIWKEMNVCSPRLVILEYNAMFGPDRAVTVPYDPQFDRFDKGGRFYYGASLAAWVRLAASKGYRLIATEPKGVNAFFLRNDVAPGIPACAVKEAFRIFRVPEGKAQGKSLAELAAENDGLPLVDVSGTA